MNKPYEWGVVCGRFQSLHKGHEKVIEEGLKICEKLLILIGSSQESGTERNPFSAGLRAEMLSNIYNKKDFPNVYIGLIPDLSTEGGISPEWGEYFLNQVFSYIKRKPDVIIFGNDEERARWFFPEQKEGIDEVVIKRAELPISGTIMRNFILENKREEWEKYTNPKNHHMWDVLQENLRKIYS